MFYFKRRKNHLDYVVPKYKTPSIIDREEWLAKRPTSTEELCLPVRHVLWFYDTDTECCYSRKHCAKIIKKLQVQTMKDFKYSDIEFNFLISGDGSVYMGRGWTAKPELAPIEHKELNGVSLAMAYIGHYNEQKPSAEMVEARYNLLAYGLDQRYLHPHYTVTEYEGRFLPTDEDFLSNNVKIQSEREKEMFREYLTYVR